MLISSSLLVFFMTWINLFSLLCITNHYVYRISPYAACDCCWLLDISRGASVFTHILLYSFPFNYFWSFHASFLNYGTNLSNPSLHVSQNLEYCLPMSSTCRIISQILSWRLSDNCFFFLISYLYYIFFDEIGSDLGPKLVLYDSKIFSFYLVSIIRSSSFRLINISWGSFSWLFCNPADLWSSSYYQVYLICFYFNCL